MPPSFLLWRSIAWQLEMRKRVPTYLAGGKSRKHVSGREIADLENSGFPQVICIVSTTLYKTMNLWKDCIIYAIDIAPPPQSFAFCKEKSLHCGNPAWNREKADMHNCFANVKHYLRQNDLALQLTLDPNPLIYNAFAQIRLWALYALCQLFVTAFQWYVNFTLPYN